MNATRSPRELHDGVLARGLGEEAQGVDGQVVVVLVERVATRLGEREHPGGAAPAAATADPLVAGLEGAVVDEVVEVTADGGRREVEPVGQLRRGGGACLEDRAYDTRPRRLVSD